MNKPLLLKALSKAYLVLNIKETEGFSVIHCSLNPKIVEMFCGNKTFNINNTNDTTVVTVVDLKNELAIDIDIEAISTLDYPGFPFEIPPVYILNERYEGRITIDDVIRIQKDALKELRYLKEIQRTQVASNNSISNKTIYNLRLLYHYYSKVEKLDKKHILFNDKILKRFKKKLPTKFILDSEFINRLLEENKTLFDFDDQEIQKRIGYYSGLSDSFYNKRLGFDVENLHSTDSDVMQKCVTRWKEIISEHAAQASDSLQKEKEVFKENNPENKTELEEIEFVQNILKNCANDVDFSKFKTPKEVFSFWPPVLYPPPEFVLDPYHWVFKK
jgi:hypothetical protein